MFWIAFLGALLPGIGYYGCIAYAYLWQADQVFNFTALDCEQAGSTLPPVSYAIGVLEPQRFIWLFVMFVNLPPRLVLSLLAFKYYANAANTMSKSRQKLFQFTQQVYIISTCIEQSSILTVSVVDMYESFFVHAGAYSTWISFLCSSMFFNCMMHKLSGLSEKTKKSKLILRIKYAMLIIVAVLGLSTGFTYPYYAQSCASWAYTAFSMAEYALVGWNSLFYFLGFIEYPRTRIEMFADFGELTEKLEIPVLKNPNTPAAQLSGML